MDHEQKTITPGLNANLCRPLIEQSSAKSPENIHPTLSRPVVVQNEHSDREHAA